jgi:hypothetical protein
MESGGYWEKEGHKEACSIAANMPVGLLLRSLCLVILSAPWISPARAKMLRDWSSHRCFLSEGWKLGSTVGMVTLGLWK